MKRLAVAAATGLSVLLGCVGFPLATTIDAHKQADDLAAPATIYQPMPRP